MAIRLDSPLHSARMVLLYLLALLLPFYLLFVFWFRPANPFAFPGLEERLGAVVSMLVVACVLFCSSELSRFIFAFMRLVFGPFVVACRFLSNAFSGIFPGAARAFLQMFSRVCRVFSGIFPDSKAFSLVFSRTYRALSWIFRSVWLFVRRIWVEIRGFVVPVCLAFAAFVHASCTFVCGHACSLYARGQILFRARFAPGREYFFATIGASVFLILSPLVVLFNQHAFSEPAIILFIAYAVISYYQKLDNRAMIVTALIFISSCPFFLWVKDSSRAELAAIYAYYALCTGVLLQLIDFVKHREDDSVCVD